MKLLRTLICVTVLVGAAGFVWADDEKVAIDKLPKAIADSLNKRFPKAELVSAEKETEDKKTTFEVNLKFGGASYDVNLNEDGTITGFEKTLDAKDLPKAVAATVAAKYPKAPVKKAEEVTKVTDGKEVVAYYEVIVTVDGKDVELEVLADGKLKPEEKGEKKEEKKEGK